ncbi:MAG TPA: SH3 domain-containing protein [Candidatus Binatia bacterium]
MSRGKISKTLIIAAAAVFCYFRLAMALEDMMHGSKRLKIALAALLLMAPISGCKNSEAPQATSPAANSEQTRLYITVEDVKVRSGPGTRYKIIAEIKADTRVNVAGQQGEWLRVVSKHGRPPGYIDHRFAKPAGPETVSVRSRNPRGIYETTADIQVREGPGLHYRSVATIREKTEVRVVGAEGDWLKVQSQQGNPPGYIERRYAERVPG